MAQNLDAILDKYVTQCKSNQTTPDRSLLQRAEEILTKRLKSQGFTQELVHEGVGLYYLSPHKDRCAALLASYLAQPLSTEEEAWARWHLTDFLAMARRYAEAVKNQKEFLAWARRTLPADRLLWVMSDGSQALCWLELGLEDEWLRIFHDIMASVVPSAENRLDRFYYLRTAGHLLLHFGQNETDIRPDEALQIAARIRELVDEDPLWDRAFDMRVQSWLLELPVYGVQRNFEQIRRLGLTVTAALEDRLQELSSMTDTGSEGVPPGVEYSNTAYPLVRDEMLRLGVLYDNAAYPLYCARQYDLAIPLFKRSIEMGSPSPHARAWLAASLWATTGVHDEVLGLLGEAAARWYSQRPLWDFIRDLPEFEDFSDQAGLEEAVAVSTTP